MNKEVHDTAFMIAHYRALHEELSCDPYAKLWLEYDILTWEKDFATKVSNHEAMLHSMRNRYFHDILQDITKKEPDTLVINIGAGFSMYPFTLSSTVKTIEIELPAITAYKKEKIARFVSSGKLPYRDITFISSDITSPIENKALFDTINSITRKRTVILIEGVFFFLSLSEIEEALILCRQILKKYDVLLCVSYDNKILSTKVFEKLKLYFADILQSHENPFTTLPHSYYKKLVGFKLKEISSSLKIGVELGQFPKHFDEKLVLNEYLYFLERL